MGSALRRWLLALVISIVWYGPLLLLAAYGQSRDNDMILFVAAIAGLPGSAFATMVSFLLGVGGHDGMAAVYVTVISSFAFWVVLFWVVLMLWARRTSGRVDGWPK
jgi:hypothetical protein